jgi:hypothetical protein
MLTSRLFQCRETKTGSTVRLPVSSSDKKSTAGYPNQVAQQMVLWGKKCLRSSFLLVGEPISTLRYQDGEIQQKKYKFRLEVCQSN